MEERRNSNSIMEFYIDQWILSDSSSISNAICHYFKSLFNLGHKDLTLLTKIPIGNVLPDSQVNFLDVDIANKEIIFALQQINENKSLDIDGFNAKFFIFNWDIVGRKFLGVVKYFFKLLNYKISLNTT